MKFSVIYSIYGYVQTSGIPGWASWDPRASWDPWASWDPREPIAVPRDPRGGSWDPRDPRAGPHRDLGAQGSQGGYPGIPVGGFFFFHLPYINHRLDLRPSVLGNG